MNETDHDPDNPYAPRALKVRDVLHDLQLLRGQAIVNARTAAELGPLPSGGLPVEPKRKPKPWPPITPQAPIQVDTENDAMKLSRVAAVATLGAVSAIVACSAGNTPQDRDTEAEPRATIDSKGTSGAQESAGSSGTTESGSMVEQSSQGRAGDQGAYGSDYGIRPTYEACMAHQTDGTSTAAYRQDCADLELEFQDERLNRIYQNLMDALNARGDEGASKALQVKNAQRAWLARLEPMCAEAAEKAGSAMGPAAQSTCFMDQTAMRAHELEREFRDGIK